MSAQHTPSAAELLANEQWLSDFAHVPPSHLPMVAEDQAKRCADYFAAIAKAQQGGSK